MKGGIAAVVDGYYGSRLERDYRLIYVESYRDGSRLQKLGKAIRAYFRYFVILFRDHPDLIHIHSSFGPSFYRSIPFILLGRWRGIPVVDHIHGSAFGDFYEKASARKKSLVKRVWKRCDAFIVLSEEWKKRFSVAMDPGKVHVIPNYGVLLSETSGGKENRRNGLQILFLGAISRMKGCYDMLGVMAILKQRIPEVRLVMAGDGEVAQIRRMAAEQGVADVISWPGWVRGEDKERLLRESDVFFLPSYTEAMPMSILDAMGAGLPIVASNVGGIPRLVEDGGNGYLCRPGDIAAFADALTGLHADPDCRTLFGEKSRNIVREQYSLEQHLGEVEQVYESLIGVRE